MNEPYELANIKLQLTAASWRLRRPSAAAAEFGVRSQLFLDGEIPGVAL
jgi:hypothetical protein